MVWKLVKLRSIVESLKAYLTLDFLPKFTRNSVQYIANYLLSDNSRIVTKRVAGDRANFCIYRSSRRCQREIVTKRLNRRKRRKLESCKPKLKPRSSKCTCTKCTGFRFVQKKRVIEPDFLANLAYSQRVSRDDGTSMDMGDVQTVGEITVGAGETWWNNVINQRNMPPINRGPLDMPTRSEYSSATSGFRTETPDIFSDDLDESRSSPPLSTVTDDKLCPDDMTHLTQPREGSKSDSKILPCWEDKASEVGPHAARSASTKTMVLGFSPKEGRSSMPTRQKREKRRKRSSARTTSHASDSFSTCVKCSRILSKAI